MLVVVLVALGATVMLLARLKAAQHLGRPGLRTHGLPGSSNLVVELPLQVLDYRFEPKPVPEVVERALPKDTSFGQGTYHAPDDFSLQVNAVLMGTDRTSIHKPQICLTAQGWQIERSEPRVVKLADGRTLPVMRLTAGKRITQADGQEVMARAVYAYWFVADGALTADHNERFAQMARVLVRTGTLQRWAYVSCIGFGYPGQEEAVWERLEKFLAAAAPQMINPPEAKP
jgi:hypothetical protein